MGATSYDGSFKVALEMDLLLGTCFVDGAICMSIV